MDYELKDLEKDALRELGNIGAGSAATALSQLLGATVQISVPKIFLTPIEEAAKILGGPETVVAGIYMKVFGDIPSKIFIFFPEKTVFPLLSVLMKAVQLKPEGLHEKEQSALKELGNILGCAYLNAMAKFLQLEFIPSVPALAVDMLGSILPEVIVEGDDSGPKALFIETQFISESQIFTGHLFLIPESESLPKLVEALLRASGLFPSN